MNFMTNWLAGYKPMKLFPHVFGVILAVFLTGCAGLHPLPDNDAAYFKQKIGQALAGNGYIKNMWVLDIAPSQSEILVSNQNCKNMAVITLNVNPINEENYSLKAMRALSRDPLIPAIDIVRIDVEQTQDSLRKAFGPGFVKGLTGKGGGPITLQTEDVTTFSCIITREALLKGEEPRVVVRNGVYVSGRYEGQRSDSLWLSEKKSKPATKPDTSPTNQNESPDDESGKVK